ncbi:juvenile hormone epoxide hydrolase 2-like [Culicoides brevitarsis]|uniref:juvenile hormone epoxide hydrolase 2-like n=1 Tax=Culicoides brevitarsis TaxID=469753 RepID=UPI00307CBDC3
MNISLHGITDQDFLKMGWCGKLLFVLVSCSVAFVYQQYHQATKPFPIPELKLQKYWGAGTPKPDNTKIDKFVVDFKQADVDKLKSKLSDTSYLSKPLEDAKFHYGFNSNKLKSVVSYWKDTYLTKWDQRQAHLNKFPQFMTQIQGLNIHFIHVVPKVTKNVKVYPILLLHGWPGSVVEFYDLIPLLTAESKDKDYVFEVIAPSLPGYGFSEAASKQGLNYAEMAIIFRNLMARLGKSRYFIQGGDWGSAIGTTMASYFPNEILGYHSNMCAVNTPIANVKTFISSFYPKYFVEKEEHVKFYYPILPNLVELLVESGYMHIQATKPDTVGTALAGNPVGLAAYIMEKFSTWTNKAYRDLEDGGLEKYFTMDALLDNIMLYYIPNSILTSQRLYKESFSNPEVFKNDRIPVTVPVACAKYRHELLNQIDWILKDKFTNLVQTSHFPDGGHFAAMQLPKVMYKDIVDFVNKVQKK